MGHGSDLVAHASPTANAGARATTPVRGSATPWTLVRLFRLTQTCSFHRAPAVRALCCAHRAAAGLPAAASTWAFFLPLLTCIVPMQQRAGTALGRVRGDQGVPWDHQGPGSGGCRGGMAHSLPFACGHGGGGPCLRGCQLHGAEFGVCFWICRDRPCTWQCSPPRPPA